jgi:hypothetical protein
MTNAGDAPGDTGRFAAALGFAGEKCGEGGGCGGQRAEIAGGTPAAKEVEIAAVGATAGVGFLGAGELEGELEFVGGRFGSELGVVGAEAAGARFGPILVNYRGGGNGGQLPDLAAAGHFVDDPLGMAFADLPGIPPDRRRET